MTALVWNGLTGSLLSHNANMHLIRIAPEVALWGGEQAVIDSAGIKT